MIALCERHHRIADRGLYTREQLRMWKAQPNSHEAVSAKFDWLFGTCIVRVGGCYALGNFELAVHGTPVLSIVSANRSAPVVFSMELRSAGGRRIATMNDNVLEYFATGSGDLEISVSSHRVRVWDEAGLIGLDCDVRRRTPDEVRAWTATDSEAPAPPVFQKMQQEFDAQNRQLAASLRASIAAPPGPTASEAELRRMVEAKIVELESPQPRRAVNALAPVVPFAAKHASDGTIVCVDLRSFNTWIDGTPVAMKGGSLTVGDRLKMHSCLIADRVIDFSDKIQIRQSSRPGSF